MTNQFAPVFKHTNNWGRNLSGKLASNANKIDRNFGQLVSANNRAGKAVRQNDQILDQGQQHFSELDQGQSALWQQGQQGFSDLTQLNQQNQEQINQQFGTLSSGLGNIGANQQAVYDSVQGFGTNLNQLGQDFTSGFADLSNLVQQGQAATQQYRDDATASRQALSTAVSNVGGAVDDNFQTLNQGQADILQGQSGMMSGIQDTARTLGDFREQYDRDVGVDRGRMGEFQTSVADQFSQLGQQMGQQSEAAATERRAIQDQIGAGSPQAGPGAAPQGPDFAQVAFSIATGQGGEQPGFQEARAQFLGRVRDMQATSAALRGQIPDQLAAQFEAVGRAFDPSNGALVPRSTDTQGNTTVRAMDQRGVLYTQTVNQAGQTLDQQQVDLNGAMQAHAQLLQAGAQGSGLMAPYART